MTTRRILVLDSLFDDLELEQAAASTRGWIADRWDGSEQQLGEADAVVHVRTRIDRAFIQRLRHCRVIGRFGVGLDSVDQQAAADHGMAVVNVRDYCIPEMTAHTLALAFSLERRINNWDPEGGLDVDWQSFARRRPIVGRTRAVVIGLGSIGAAVAGALRQLGYTVVAVTSHGQATADRIGLRTSSLEHALPDADVVFLHTALDASTANLIDARRLVMLPGNSILINTARLGLIDQAAVADALAQGQLGGLGLDARLEASSPLRNFASDPRVLITPHVGWYSERSARVLRERAITNAIDAYATVEARKAS